MKALTHLRPVQSAAVFCSSFQAHGSYGGLFGTPSHVDTQRTDRTTSGTPVPYSIQKENEWSKNNAHCPCLNSVHASLLLCFADYHSFLHRGFAKLVCWHGCVLLRKIYSGDCQELLLKNVWNASFLLAAIPCFQVVQMLASGFTVNLVDGCIWSAALNVWQVKTPEDFGVTLASLILALGKCPLWTNISGIFVVPCIYILMKTNNVISGA